MATSTASDLESIAARALERMQAAGFDQAHATASRAAKDEVNIAHNEPSLLRSTTLTKLVLVGIAAGRRVVAELSAMDGDGAADGIGERIAELRAEADAVPADDAHGVSSGEQARIVQGPQTADLDAVTAATRDLLAFRAAETPLMVLDECFVSHTLVRSHTQTSGGSDLATSVGCYEASVFGTARDGAGVSSFAMAAGSSDSLAGRIEARFGIAEMLRDTERQIRVRRLGERFEGDVVLAPAAVTDLLSWLLGRLDDMALIGGTSIYRDRIGERIASPLLSLASRFDAPGVAAVSADGFRARPVEVLREGRLLTALPTLYGSRKTGLPHVPVAAAGWTLAGGDASVDELVSGADRGAFVGRLSMGRPAANGDFSGVIKNSFAIDGGAIGDALSETMISGNVARMLEAVAGVSRERLDTGAWRLPWLRIGGLHFS